VRADEAQARSIGIRGVPFFVIGGKYAVSGAQPAELLKGAIERAAREQLQAESAPEGATCGVDGCS
jgi:predicted DsbA family dithiol-disulfide isomerase